MPRPERFSSIQALAWLSAIAEDDSGDESEGENICKGLDQGSANSDQDRPTWEVIYSDGSDLEIDIDSLEQTDSASCQLVSSGSGSNDTSTAAEEQGDGLLQTPRKLDWWLKTEQNGNTSNFLQNREVSYKLRTC